MIIRVVDTETTGLPPDFRVVEVATIDLVLDEQTGQWRKGRVWSSLINPGISIPPDASGIHHITDEMVRDAPTLGAVMDRVLLLDEPNLMAPDYLAAHEAAFDREALGLNKPADTAGTAASAPIKWICTRKCAVTFWPDAPNFKNQTLRYYLKIKLSDPDTAIPHRATGDAYVTAAILRRMLSLQLIDQGNSLLEAVTPEALRAISAGPVLLPRLTFGKHAMQPCASIPTDYWDWVIKNITDDEDVIFTARSYLAARQRNRSPV